MKSAQVAICGLGFHELYLNGSKVGDHVLDPAQTTYDKRAFYVVHDVTKSLRKGDNAIGVMLGNGFFGQNIAFGVASLMESRGSLIMVSAMCKSADSARNRN